MAGRILLFDPDERHAKAVVAALEKNGHKLTRSATRQEAFRHLRAKLAQFTVIVLDFSNRPEDWEFLDKIRKLTVMYTPKPGVLCLARTNCGPSVKLQVERKGARLVYERPA